MSRKRFSVEQIINQLREAEVLLAQGVDGWGDLPPDRGIGAELLSLAAGVRRAEG